MQTLTTNQWPPQFTITKSTRARHVRLKASTKNGLELVVPTRFNAKEIPYILEKNRSWIEKQLLYIQSQLTDVGPDVLPNEIRFTALNKTWKVEYYGSDSNKIRIITRPHQHEIVLFGNIEDQQLCKKALSAWSKLQAKVHLVNKLMDISQEIQLPYQSVTIRDQSSLWGSCSAKKIINLNFKLLFLPPELTRYVLIHELCHTVHLNHSDKFWRLVEKFDPEWKTHRNKLRQVTQLLPSWIT